MMLLKLFGTCYFGMADAITWQAATHLFALPAIIWLTRAYGGWDGLHDILFFVDMSFFGGVALWLHHDGILELVHNNILG